jgi:hypothetical protein
MIRRRSRLPDEVRSHLQLRERERILAWADDGEGRPVVASETALHLQRNPPAYSRFSWHQIEQARYEDGVMTVVLVPDLGSATLRVPVGESRDLPVAVRDRVTASVAVDRFVVLEGDRGARIVARKTDDGGLSWRLDLDPDLVGHPDVVKAAESALEEVKREVLID